MDAIAATSSALLTQGYTMRDEDNMQLAQNPKTAIIPLPVTTHDGLILDVDPNPIVPAPGLPNLVAPGKQFNALPMCSCLLGIAVATTWIAATSTVPLWSIWFSRDFFIYMQFFYVISLFLFVTIFEVIENFIVRVFGAKNVFRIMHLTSWAGCSTLMYVWSLYEFPSAANKTSLRVLACVFSGLIGFCSAAGYFAVSFSFRRMSAASKSSYSQGLWFGAIINIVTLLLSGYTQVYSNAISYYYWYYVGGIVSLFGIAAHLIEFSTTFCKGLEAMEKELALRHCDRVLRVLDNTFAAVASQSSSSSDRSLARVVLNLQFPLLICAMSFTATSFVLVHFPYLQVTSAALAAAAAAAAPPPPPPSLPSHFSYPQSCSPNMPTVWVYVMLFGVHIGQQMSSLSQDGLLPFSVRWSISCALVEFVRVALALLMILFIRQPPFVDDRWMTLILLSFFTLGSFTCSQLIKITCSRVRESDRALCCKTLRFACFAGQIIGFILGFILYSQYWESFSLGYFGVQHSIIRPGVCLTGV